MRQDGGRWLEVTPSRFPHEYGGLTHVRERLPDIEPYRAWSNFEFVSEGRCHEVDLLVLAPAGLFLVELKGWRGRIHGTEQRWKFSRPSRISERNPLVDANDKARTMAAVLRRHVRRHDISAAKRLPRIEAAVFLYDPAVRFEIPERTGIFGREGLAAVTGLSGVVTGLLCRPPAPGSDPVDATRAAELVALLDESGIMHRRRVRVGPYVLDDSALFKGPGWCDYLATHERRTGERVRVRVYLANRTVSGEDRQRLERAAEREFRLERALNHPGIVRPEFDGETPMGPAIVYPHDSMARRLDDLLVTGSALSLAGKLHILRGIVEAVKHAHDQRITHRALTPSAVIVMTPAEAGPTVQITDWQAAAQGVTTASPQKSLLAGTRNINALLDERSHLYIAPEVGVVTGYDEVRADVFSIGAIAYVLLGGRLPDCDSSQYRAQLARDRGLLLTTPGLPPALVELVRAATEGEVTRRLPTADAVLELLATAQAAVAPATADDVDPLKATEGAVLDDRWRLLRPLGSGTTGTALLVADTAAGGRRCVLKVANDASGARRLRTESTVLSGLDSPLLARLVERPMTIHGRTAVAIEYAGDQSLAALLRSGRLPLETLAPLGGDLLEVATYLTSQGVFHRDIKPANLGIRSVEGQAAARLVLFDFSHSSEPDSELEVGTPPYLDPFLGTARRPHYDIAAEMYAVAVTLFEMATGQVPVFGDGLSHAAALDVEATVRPEMFDPAVASALSAFFQRALSRDSDRRFRDLATMQRAWTEATTPTGGASALAARLSATVIRLRHIARRPVRRRQHIAAILVAVLVMTLAAAVQRIADGGLAQPRTGNNGGTTDTIAGLPQSPSDLAAWPGQKEFVAPWDRYPAWERCGSGTGDRVLTGSFPAHRVTPRQPVHGFYCDNGGNLTVIFALFLSSEEYNSIARSYFRAKPPPDPVGAEKTPPSDLHVFAWSSTHRALVWSDGEAMIGVAVTDSRNTDLVELWGKYHN